MLKKVFWLLVILLISLSAYLAADIVIVYLKKLCTVPPRAALFVPAKEETFEPLKKGRDYYRIISHRDLFRVSLEEEEKTVSMEEEMEKVAPLTDLKLKLLGTMIGKGVEPYAIIKDLKTQRQDLYRVGDKVGPAELIKIYRHKVILRREGAEEMLIAFENFEITQDKESADYTEKPTISKSYPNIIKQTPRERYSEIGKKIAPNHWVLKRNEVEGVIENATQLLTQVRIIPHFKAGDINQPDGFQVANIIPRSLFDKMGLRSGDIIKSVNGEAITNPEKAFEAYQRLKNESRINVIVNRNNQELNLTYDISE